MDTVLENIEEVKRNRLEGREAAERWCDLLLRGEYRSLEFRLIPRKDVNGHPIEYAVPLEVFYAKGYAEDQADYNIYAVVNGGGRRDAHIDKVRAFFIDADKDNDVKISDVQWHTEPDFICVRTEVNWHAYWLAADDVTPEEFTEGQKRLAKHHGTDKVVCNPSRIMRLPGFTYAKDPDHPEGYRLYEMGCSDLPGDCQDGVTFEALTAGLPELTEDERKYTAREKHKDREKPIVALDQPDSIERAEAYLAAREGALDGRENEAGVMGNEWTYQTACGVRDFGISEDLCIKMMHESDWNQKRCKPAWTFAELDEWRGPVSNAYEYSQNRSGAKAHNLLKVGREIVAPRMNGAGYTAADGSLVIVDSEDDVEVPGDSAGRSENTEPMETETALILLKHIRQVSEIRPDKIPMRHWLLGDIHAPGYLSMTVGAGGGAKTIHNMTRALALASGKELTGEKLHQGPQRVFYLNLEDPQEEMDRRFAAIAQFHGLDGLPDRLQYLSGLSLPTPIKFAREEYGAVAPDYEVIRFFEALLADYDMFYADPLVKLADLPENDNSKMDSLMTVLAGIAARTRTGIHLVDHMSQSATKSRTTDAWASRGATAKPFAARMVETFHTATEAEADAIREAHGATLRDLIKSDLETWRFKRITTGKANLTPPIDGCRWFLMASITLNNNPTDGARGDNVGVSAAFAVPKGTVESAEVQLASIGEWLLDQDRTKGEGTVTLSKACTWLAETGRGKRTTAFEAIPKFLGAKVRYLEGIGEAQIVVTRDLAFNGQPGKKSQRLVFNFEDPDGENEGKDEIPEN